ncbi:Helix-turn-helix domain-containing protein [Amycolatopsis arida]|uniref:Helix-turn-helix domain-containing protein n=1 Tax=Amycolatopsis arida TaxID=587909 RepID=A0A1I5XID2_9PSEU|nr:helix-turn-helix domain-containing protein [Amycolatopsis arida]TDX97429.1 helix-turn-helix protein [Amycolatopsis arida]SFQ31700.1 Helix-turn-helix domain-containing protein [Amycolatopsis arida]
MNPPLDTMKPDHPDPPPEWRYADLAVARIGQAFADLRRDRGQAQAAAANAAGLHPSQLSRFELGHRGATLTQFTRLCVVLDLHPARVLARALPPHWPPTTAPTSATLIDPHGV